MTQQNKQFQSAGRRAQVLLGPERLALACEHGAEPRCNTVFIVLPPGRTGRDHPGYGGAEESRLPRCR